ncbi:MAG: response regulator [Chloroflexota bacterium]
MTLLQSYNSAAEEKDIVMNDIERPQMGEMPHAIIVEDEESLSTIFRKAIDMAGYSVEVISNGKEALNRLQNIAPNLLLLDLHLPQVTGEEIIEAVRQKPEFSDTRIILATADARLGNHIESKADLVLIKPIRFSTLKRLATRFNPSHAA